MAHPGYTHRVLFKLGDDGSKFVIADIDFSEEQKRFIISTSEPLPAGLLSDFESFVSQLSNLHTKYGGVKIVVCKEFNATGTDFDNLDSDVETPTQVVYKNP